MWFTQKKFKIKKLITNETNLQNERGCLFETASNTKLKLNYYTMHALHNA